MRQAWKNSPLIVVIGALLFVYHGYNAFHPDKYLAPLKWEPSSIIFHLGSREILRIPTIAGNKRMGGLIDASADRIAEVGGAMRFLAGQTHPMLALGPLHPYQRIYLRAESFFQFPQSPDWIEKHFRKQLREFIDGIERSGATVVIVPIPTKLSLERERVSRPPAWDLFAPVPPFSEENPYGFYKAVVDTSPAHIVDLFRIYREHLDRHPEDDVFIPMDTHWASLGIALAAKGVIERLAVKGWNVRVPQVLHVATNPPLFDYDHFKLLRLPEYLFSRWAPFRWKHPLYRLERAVPEGAGGGRVILAGTSNTGQLTHTPYQFGALMAESLGRELIWKAVPANVKGFPALRYLKERVPELMPGDLFVLEFPFRFPWDPRETLPVPGEGTPVVRTLSTSPRETQ